jgi:ATP-dependent Clp protease adapter protein ClpS
MSQTLIQPQIDNPGTGSGRWMVVIYNNDHTPMELVVLALIRATACTLQEAEMETWEAHHFGKAPVHFAAKQDCEKAAAVIESIGVKTEVTPEWDD